MFVIEISSEVADRSLCLVMQKYKVQANKPMLVITFLVCNWNLESNIEDFLGHIKKNLKESQ